MRCELYSKSNTCKYQRIEESREGERECLLGWKWEPRKVRAMNIIKVVMKVSTEEQRL